MAVLKRTRRAVFESFIFGNGQLRRLSAKMVLIFFSFALVRRSDLMDGLYGVGNPLE